MIVEQDENMQMELLTPLTANFMPETSYWNELMKMMRHGIMSMMASHWMEQTLSSIRMRSRRWWIKKIHLEVKMANLVI